MMEEENRQLKEHIEYLQKSGEKNSKIVRELYAKNTFFVELIDISISFGLDNPDIFYGTIQVEDKSYEINKVKINAIKDIITSNFDKLLEIAKNQTLDMYAGGYGTLHIKVASIFMSLYYGNVTTEEELNFIHNIVQEIINIAKK